MEQGFFVFLAHCLPFSIIHTFDTLLKMNSYLFRFSVVFHYLSSKDNKIFIGLAYNSSFLCTFAATYQLTESKGVLSHLAVVSDIEGLKLK